MAERTKASDNDKAAADKAKQAAADKAQQAQETSTGRPREGDRSGVPKSREESPVSPAVEAAGVTPTEPGETVPAVPDSIPGVDTGVSAEAAPNPLRGITGQPRETEDTTPDVHSDPPPTEGLTPEDEVREEHIRRKMTGGGGGTVLEQERGLRRSLEDHQAALHDVTMTRLTRQMQLPAEEVERVRLFPVDLAVPPILGHKLASHDEHRLASDDARSDVDKCLAAVLEARYPVSVSQAGFQEAMRDERLSEANRIELRQMARRNEVYIRGR